MLNFLIKPIPAPVVKESVDSVKQALLDTTGKTSVEKDVINSVNALTSSTADEIWSNLMDKAIQFGLKLLAAAAIFLIGMWLMKILKKAIRRAFERHKTEPAIVSFTMSMVTAILWVILIIITVGALGVETTSLAALLAAGGMAIGMALSGAVQNFAGGILIIIFKPFKVGDYIEAQGFAGTVSEMNITSTKIVTVDNKLVILPNGPLQSGVINNYSGKDFRRVDITVSVEYGTEAKAVKQALLDIAAAEKRVLTVAQGAPADPFVALANLGSSSVDYTYRLWVRSSDYWCVFFDINETVYTELPKKGIGFPFPQLSVHMEK